MAELNKAVTAKLKKQGKTYEIFVDSESALKFKKGENISISDVLVTDEIFYDSKKGNKASAKELKLVFGTDDKEEICKIIIKEGEVPFTAEMKRKELEAKRKQIVYLIHRNVVDPKTEKPHPIQRIDSAIDEAKAKIDPNKSAEQQLQEVITKIRTIIPIKYEVRELSVRLLPEHTSRAFPLLKKYGTVLNEKWQNDGSLLVSLEIPAGVQEELELALNNIAKGTVDVKIIKAR